MLVEWYLFISCVGMKLVVCYEFVDGGPALPSDGLVVLDWT